MATIAIVTVALGSSQSLANAVPRANTLDGVAKESNASGFQEKASQFIHFDDVSFTLDDESASDVLSPGEIEQVKDKINSTDTLISQANTTSGVQVADANSSSITFIDETLAGDSALEFQNGVTKVKVHWNNIAVWLSQDALRKIGSDVGIASNWIPAGVVAKVLATLGGAIAAFAPGGIYFRYIPVNTVYDAHWQ